MAGACGGSGDGAGSSEDSAGSENGATSAEGVDGAGSPEPGTESAEATGAPQRPAHRPLSKSAARLRSVDLLERVGIPDADRRARRYPHELSGGMRQRVMIAMAIALDPAVLIVDEPTTALDATVQAQVLEVLSEVRQRMSGAMMIISHDLGVVAGAADRVIVMYAGHCVERGDVHDVYHRASHPYTAGLLAAVPRLDRVATRLTPIAGSPPGPVGAAPGCSFAPRCPIATEVCSQQEPDLRGPQGQPAVAALMEAAVACHHSAVDSRG